jgi:hypothetical protein
MLLRGKEAHRSDERGEIRAEGRASLIPANADRSLTLTAQ